MQKSVRPSEVSNDIGDVEAESDADDERDSTLEVGEPCERIALEREGAEVRKLVDPALPSQKEVDDHWIRGHIPYRNWCEICVRSKGKDMDHTQDKGQERRIPEYHFDYCFPGDELGFKWTVLCGKERMSKSWFGTAVPMKGASGRFSTDKCLEFMGENGDTEGKIIVKTDQEPSIKYLVDDIIERRAEGRTIYEHSPVQSSGSNGVVERGVNEIEGSVRAILLSLQERLGRKGDARELIISFIPEYAAYMLNRFSVGKDGKVPYERIKGKKPTVLGVEFGEKVLFKKKKIAKLEKLNPR